MSQLDIWTQRFAPFLWDIEINQLAEGPMVRAQFDGAALPDVHLPVALPSALSRALPKRQAEFLAGRALAHIAQDALGREPQPVDVASDRSPIWPVGLSGSVTHSGGQAAVWLTAMPSVALGLDLEHVLSGDGLRAVQKRVLTPQDAALVADDAWAATIVFSAKETLYKALYPSVGRFFGFEAAHVVGLEARSVHLALTLDLTAQWRRGHVFDVTVERQDATVLTSLSVHVEAKVAKAGG